VRNELTGAIGFGACRDELGTLLNEIGIRHKLTQEEHWRPLLGQLMELIRDVPLSFPRVGDLRGRARKIYEGIAQNPIKAGAGVVAITLSRVDYGLLGALDHGELMCLLIRTEDGVTIVVPLKI